MERFVNLHIAVGRQLLIGLAAGLLDFLMSYLCVDLLALPLYTDCIFTVAASFLGAWSGVAAGVMVHVFRIIVGDRLSLLFIICSVSVVPLVRLLMKIEELPFYIVFMLLVSSMTLVISVEGGIIYMLLFERLSYMETSATNAIVFSLVLRNVPLLVSSIAGRIPVNFLDKLIACFAGYLLARCTARKCYA